MVYGVYTVYSVYMVYSVYTVYSGVLWCQVDKQWTHEVNIVDGICNHHGNKALSMFVREFLDWIN